MTKEGGVEQSSRAKAGRCLRKDVEQGDGAFARYDWSTFTRDSTYGITTPHSNAGEFTKRTLKWIHDVNTEKGAKIVAELVDDFREKSQPQIGKVHDPIVETLKVPADHTFGIMLRPDEYGAGDLLHGRAPNAYLRGRDRERGVLHAIRQHLKKANYHNFDDLSQAFAHYDKNGDGFIDANELGEVCHQLNVPIEDEMLALLMSYCACADSGPLRIDYLKFANFLNWKDKMPLPADKRNGKELPVPATPTLPKQIDRAVTQHMTSSSVIGALADISTYGYRKYGVPTVRADLAPPKLKRVSDTKNYGDESDAYGVINPSIYSRAGVYESDFFAPRSRDEIKMIFANVGVDIAPDTFDQAWTRAASRDPRSRGEVCVETFRSVLDDVQAQAILSQ